MGTESLVARTLVEPYRVKMVERVRLLDRDERLQVLQQADYSIVRINSRDVFIDLLTDSGTSAMSDEQWSGLMRGDEAYARSRSFDVFEAAVQRATGYAHVVPTHQGRAAENIVCELLVPEDSIVLSNTHFDTTRAHVQNRGALPLDLVGDGLWRFGEATPFKGNFDLAKLRLALELYAPRIALVVITVLNNLAGSSPVPMENIRTVWALADEYDLPVMFDAARFAENAYLIQQREPGYAGRSVRDIAREMFSYGDGCWMSLKKDGLTNIGGFIATKDEALARRCQEKLVLYEGFPTYGGLAGRDLEVAAIGLEEVLDPDYLDHRINQVAYLGEVLKAAGVVVSEPVGGSAVFADVWSVYPHLTPHSFPEVTLCSDVYLEGGVRIAGYPFNILTMDLERREMVERIFHFARFAVPRRVYTKGHIDYIGEVMHAVKENAEHSKGLRLVEAPEILPHFFARFAPLE